VNRGGNLAWAFEVRARKRTGRRGKNFGGRNASLAESRSKTLYSAASYKGQQRGGLRSSASNPVCFSSRKIDFKTKGEGVELRLGRRGGKEATRGPRLG